ncbi:glyoxalase [Mesobacterium sp. TK19101]|uniref:Glyoxalase n=1 Tax=Mesobacterium hydrothermale TaxID=3111907 RepID=A0ABU6HLB9_9RHOB|nr:glyoxalase [Mesobacterium sp. TK19101]MEC3862887.1 glyoxalase [Mesobacterium sp. TK19101]
MDYDTVPAADFGASLRGLGLNIVVRDVRAQVAMLTAMFGMHAYRVSADFAILRYGAQVFQLHSDKTYGQNPLLGLLPENPPRGAGIELRLYDTDPDIAADKAESHGMTLLQPPTDKPHGLRECYLLCPDGYAWIPSRVL